MAGDSPRRKASLALAYFQALVSRPLRLPEQADPQELWRSSPRALAALLNLRPAEAQKLATFRKCFSARAAQERLNRSGIYFTALGNSDYPQDLARIYDPPLGLFVAGDAQDRWEEFMAGPRIAIVGARGASRYGIDAAAMMATELARAAVCVVSGMALGVDSAAHRGALSGAGGSIAVLGCGVDVVYPRANRLLYGRLLKKGLIVSEYPPGTEPRHWRFPARNRVISGLSRGVVVVEAREKSGALITADFCLEQGREVYAVPGSIFSGLSAGPNGLIRMGATAVTGAADILEDLGMEAAKGSPAGQVTPGPLNLTDDEDRVYAVLSSDFRHQDFLAAQAGLDGPAAAAALVLLELKGLARHEPGCGYAR